MSAERILVLGTRNAKKQRELEILLRGTGVTARSLSSYPNAIEPEETGSTFQENAAIKAREQAIALGAWVLGEDSGLCVEALGGAPGVISARFSGPAANDSSNNALLMERLQGLPAEKRGAYYVCHMTLADPTGEIRIDCEETCRGRIISQATGSGGFGYDPYFEIPEYHRTFAELGDAVKSMISHRARAMRLFLAKLQVLIGNGGWPV